MNSAWKRMTILECASSEPYSTQIGPFGKALEAKEYVVRGVPVLRGTNVNKGRYFDDDYVFITDEKADQLSKFEAFPEDILLVHKGTLGKIGLMPTKRKFSRYILGNSMMRVRCNKEILLPDYLYYWLSSIEGQNYLNSRISQVGVPQLQTPLTTLREATLLVPPIKYQEKVLSILKPLDDKIELNNQMNETLEAMARAIFKEWFIDFGPVRAKAEGRRPFGMDDETAALFPDSFEESELGIIPKGWRVVDLDSIAEILNGFAFKSEDYIDEGVFVLRTKNFSDQGFAERLPDDVFLTQEKAEEFRSYFVQPFDIHLVMVAASIGKTSITPPCILPALRNQNMWCFRNLKNFPYRHVLNLIVPIVTRELKGFSSGSARDFFRKGDFQQFKIAIPTDDILVKLENHSKIIYDLIASNIEENVSFTQARDLLLPKLISGEIILE